VAPWGRCFRSKRFRWIVPQLFHQRWHHRSCRENALVNSLQYSTLNPMKIG
jgi:hypothetical protein